MQKYVEEYKSWSAIVIKHAYLPSSEIKEMPSASSRMKHQRSLANQSCRFEETSQFAYVNPDPRSDGFDACRDDGSKVVGEYNGPCDGVWEACARVLWQVPEVPQEYHHLGAL